MSEFEELSCLLLQHVGVLQSVDAISAILALYLKYFIFSPKLQHILKNVYHLSTFKCFTADPNRMHLIFFFSLIENTDNSGCCAGAAGRTCSHNRVVTGIEVMSCLKERRVAGEWLYNDTVGVLGKVFHLLCVHVSVTIQRDNQRCVSVCLKLLGVLCVFPRVWQHMPQVTAEQTKQR